MGKRRRSPSPNPGAPTPLAGLFALPELFLHVLSFLPPADLAHAEAVSRQWARVVADPQLWKRLYLERYAHPHHPDRRIADRGGSDTAPSGRTTPMRPIARLPSRAFPPPSPSPTPTGEEQRAPFDGVDWKALLRLGTNWSNGRVLSEASVPLPPLPPSPVSPAPALTTTEPPAVLPSPTTNAESRQHLALFPSFIAASSPASPLVHVFTASGVSLGLVPPPPGWSSPARPDNVSAIVADQAVTPPEDGFVPARLGVFYASGGFVVLRLRLESGRLVWARESVVALARTRPRRLGRRAREDGNDPVVLAAMHTPLLVTCTRAFNLGVYTLGVEPSLVRTLSSDVSFHPASLSLLPTSAGFRAALTFTTPVYPSSWTVAVQELQIQAIHKHFTVHRGDCHHVHAKCDTGWPRRIEPVRGVRGPLGVGSDGRWCVLAGEDSVIHVFSLPPEETTRCGTSSEGDGIAHADTLLAPVGVGALSLAAGRCVSSGGGRVLVWELDEEGEAREIAREGEARVGSARGRYVEVRCRHIAAAVEQSATVVPVVSDKHGITPGPNPRSVSAAARSLFLAPPPAFLPPGPTAPTGEHAVQQLAFDEEKIVGLAGDVLRIWSFR